MKLSNSLIALFFSLVASVPASPVNNGDPAPCYGNDCDPCYGSDCGPCYGNDCGPCENGDCGGGGGGFGGSPNDVCGTLNGNPQCCRLDILDAMDFDCTTPYTDFSTGAELIQICGLIDKIGKCCAFEMADQGFSCIDVIP